MNKKQLTTRIETAKKRLLKKSICENFGQSEVRKIYDLIPFYEYGTPEQREMYNMASSFSRWCENYTGR
jgi:hypothetical protein